MIPKRMHEFLTSVLPEQALITRRIVENNLVYLEFDKKDSELLKGLGIRVDELGPMKVVCMWDDDHELEIGGYLVVDNLEMGRPSLGGIRLLPPPDKRRPIPDTFAVFNLARGMTLKNAAADLRYGGGKSGIVMPEHKLEVKSREVLVERFGVLLQRYADIYNPGPDVGITDADMKTIAIMNGLDNVVSKPTEMGGNQIDIHGGAARGVVVAIRTLRRQYHLLNKLPQFKDVVVPQGNDFTVLIQGFGAVGAHTANFLQQGKPEEIPRILGISDQLGYIFSEQGLSAKAFFERWFHKLVKKEKDLLVITPFIKEYIQKEWDSAEEPLFFSNNRDNLLRESAFCFVPATPVRHYIGVDPSTRPSVTVDQMGSWRMIVEGANTYSPDEDNKRARKRMEREVFRKRGVMIATDFLVNSGGVIFATYEHIIPTPAHLRIPGERLGNRPAVEEWLEIHAVEFSDLARRRLKAAEEHLEKVIERNIVELVDLLVENPDLLPCDAAERIAINRINAQKRKRTAADVMEEIPLIKVHVRRSTALQELVNSNSDILAVISDDDTLVGVITHWDLTRSFVENPVEDIPVEAFMTKEVIPVRKDQTLEECARILESYNISAMPVVETNKKVIGLVCGDILAKSVLCRPGS